MKRNPNLDPRIYSRLTKRNQKITVYFNQVITEDICPYYFVKNVKFFNPFVLAQDRLPQNIFFLSSDTMNLAVAANSGLCIVPLPQFELELAERYLHLNRLEKDVQFQDDLNFLFQKIEEKKQLSSDSNDEPKNKTPMFIKESD